MLILKIAFRNIMRHRGKSLIIGIILLLGALIMTVGNAVIQGTEEGIEENLVNRFTGHIILVSNKENMDNVLLDPMGKSIKIIDKYEEIKEMLNTQNYIESFIPMTRGVSLIFGLEEDFWGLFVFGTNFEDYQKTYLNNVEIVEGELLKNGQKGILISEYTREQIYKLFNIWIVPEGYALIEENLPEEALEYKDNLDIKNDLVFMGWGEGNMNTDIRLPITGIIKFKTLNEVWHDVCFMDIESFRECFGYFTASDTANALTDEKLAELSIINDDDVFGGDDFFGSDDLFIETEISDISYDFESLKAQTEKQETEINLDSGAYNYVSIKLKPGVEIYDAIELLNSAIEESEVEARIIHWKDATAQISMFVFLIKITLAVFIFLLFFVALIVIMNTLSMAAIERTEEIGMMRAIGSLKGFITKMFIAETSILSSFFGGAGILLGIIIVKLLSFLNISAGDNDILHLVFGGDTFNPIITADGIINGIILLIFVTAIALIYPVKVARKISPLDAVTRN